jgi:hypothetical protein
MINFFRKIRKKMADDNKPMKYLLYAIGEIALVVIGILLAFQVNNWKEGRSQRKTEQLFLTDLLHDLTLDSIQLASMHETDTERFRTKPLLLKYLRKESTSPDSIIFYFDKQFNIPITPFVPNSTTMEEGKLSSGLSFLGDRQLRRSIVSLYENYNFNEKGESIYLRKFNEIQGQIFPVVKDLRHPTLEEISIFQKHPEFINMLAFNYGDGQYHKLTFLVNQNAELLARIRSHIKLNW